MMTMALSASIGCGGNVLIQGSGGASSGTGTTSGTNTTNVATTGTGANTVGATTGTGAGGTCQTDADCAPTDACIHADGLCGKGVVGKCQTKTFPPCAVLPPACFCNGTIGQPCGTVDVSNDPSLCSKGTFACGPIMCKDYLEYCIPPGAQPAGGGPFAGCVSAPSQCTHGIVDCGCLQAANVSGVCTDDGHGGVTVMQVTAG